MSAENTTSADDVKVEPVVDGSPGPMSSDTVPTGVPAVSASVAESQASQTVGDEEDSASPVVAEPSISQETEIPQVLTATALISLEALSTDDTFDIRGAGDDDAQLPKLATDVARLGQLFPVDVRPLGENSYQLITGFRRVAALRFLKRDKVSVRLHLDLSDDDALLLALASAIHGQAVPSEVLQHWQERLTSEGRLTPPVRDMLEKALATDDTLSPEENEEEVDADELAADVTSRLGQCNQDLSLLADVFTELEPEKRRELLTQLRYSIDLVKFLESKS